MNISFMHVNKPCADEYAGGSVSRQLQTFYNIYFKFVDEAFRSGKVYLCCSSSFACFYGCNTCYCVCMFVSYLATRDVEMSMSKQKQTFRTGMQISEENILTVAL